MDIEMDELLSSLMTQLELKKGETICVTYQNDERVIVASKGSFSNIFDTCIRGLWSVINDFAVELDNGSKAGSKDAAVSYLTHKAIKRLIEFEVLEEEEDEDDD